MKVSYVKKIGEINTEVHVEFCKFNDDVADLLAFLDFPLRVEYKQDNKKEERTIVNVPNT